MNGCSTPFKHNMAINILKSCKSVFAYVKNYSFPSHIRSSFPWRPPLAEILDPRLNTYLQLFKIFIAILCLNGIEQPFKGHQCSFFLPLRRRNPRHPRGGHQTQRPLDPRLIKKTKQKTHLTWHKLVFKSATLHSGDFSDLA